MSDPLRFIRRQHCRNDDERDRAILPGQRRRIKDQKYLKTQDTTRSLSPFFLQLAWRPSLIGLFFFLPVFLALTTKRLPFDDALLQARVQLLILYTLVSFASARALSARFVTLFEYSSSFFWSSFRGHASAPEACRPALNPSDMEDDSPWHDDEVYTADGAGNAAAPGAPTRIAEQEWNNLEQRYADVSRWWTRG